MNKNNKKKNDTLGIPFGTASNKLKKNIMFYLLKKLDENICYRCGKRIETVDELSIEHKIDWLNSETPKELFWDIENNITFSHLHCNIAAQEKTTLSKEERKANAIKSSKNWYENNKNSLEYKTNKNIRQRENYKSRYYLDSKFREDKIKRNELYRKNGTSAIKK